METKIHSKVKEIVEKLPDTKEGLTVTPQMLTAVRNKLLDAAFRYTASKAKNGEEDSFVMNLANVFSLNVTVATFEESHGNDMVIAPSVTLGNEWKKHIPNISTVNVEDNIDRKTLKKEWDDFFNEKGDSLGINTPNNEIPLSEICRVMMDAILMAIVLVVKEELEKDIASTNLSIGNYFSIVFTKKEEIIEASIQVDASIKQKLKQDGLKK